MGRLDGRPVTLRVTGVFQLGDLYGDRWTGDGLLRSGVQTGDYTTYGPLVVSADTFLDRFATDVLASWRLVPDLRDLPRDRLPSFSASWPPSDLASGRAAPNARSSAGCPTC